MQNNIDEYEQEEYEQEQEIDLGYENLEFVEPESYDGLQWKPSGPGDNIIGKYISTEEGKGKGTGCLFHKLTDTHGQKVSIRGVTVLNKKIEHIEPGTIIKIVYLGIAYSNQGREYHNYNILVAKNS